MLDLSKLLKTQYDEFVSLLTGLDILCIPACLLKTKFAHLQAVVEHERLVKSVATICDKRNQNKIIIKPNENTLETVSFDCDRDDSVDGECGQDESKTELNCNLDGTVGNDYKQDDGESGPECFREGTVDNECKQDDHKPETNCKRNDTFDNECEQDDCKPMVNCLQDANCYVFRDATVDDGFKTDGCKQDDFEYKQDDGKPDLSCDQEDTVGEAKTLCPRVENISKSKRRTMFDTTIIFGGCPNPRGGSCDFGDLFTGADYL